MSSGKIVAGGRDGWTDEGSIRGPRGPKNHPVNILSVHRLYIFHVSEIMIVRGILNRESV